MALAEALLVLVDGWDALLAGLDRDASEQVAQRAAELVAAESSTAGARIGDHLLDIVAEHLPVDHPILAAMYAEGGVRFVSERRSNWPQIVAGFRQHLNQAAAVAYVRGDDPETRLLAAPAYTPTDLESAGVDPALLDLIRLDAPNGSVRLPAFQFDTGLRPLPLVLRINRLLDANSDPWGVADWWLGPNFWLGDRPVNLIDPAYEDTLLAAADAELED